MKYRWLFKIDDGTSIEAVFSDEEIKQMEIKYPEVKWDKI